MATIRDIKNEHAQYAQELRNLREKNKNELEKVKIGHQLQKNTERASQVSQMEDLKNTHKVNILNEISRKDKILGKLQQQIDKTKEYTQNERAQTYKRHKDSKELEKLKFEKQMENIKFNNALRLDEANESGNLQIQQIQRQIDDKKRELQRMGKIQNRSIRKLGKKENQRLKDEFNQKQALDSNRFQMKLASEKKTQNEVLAQMQKDHNFEVDKRYKDNQNKYEVMSKNAANKLKVAKDYFQNRYSKQMVNDNQKLQYLESKKDNYINSLRSYILDEVRLDMKKSDDPFYSTKILNYNLEEDNKEKAYLLKIPAPKYLYDKVQVTGKDKKLTLSMTRDFDHTNNDKDGQVTTTKKVESFVSKIDLGKSINPKKVEKSYQDDQIIFKIAYL